MVGKRNKPNNSPSPNTARVIKFHNTRGFRPLTINYNSSCHVTSQIAQNNPAAIKQKIAQVTENVWNEVIIYNVANRQSMFSSLLTAYKSFKFYPVGSVKDGTTEKFIAIMSKELLHQMIFANNLTLIDYTFSHSIALNLNVGAVAKDNTLTPEHKIFTEISRFYQTISDISKLSTTFNVSKYLLVTGYDLVLNFASLHTVELVCKTMVRVSQTTSYRKIDSVSFSHCNLNRLKPLAALKIMNLKFLDLSHNNITDVNELVHLKDLGLEHICLIGNIIMHKENTTKRISDILPKVYQMAEPLKMTYNDEMRQISAARHNMGQPVLQPQFEQQPMMVPPVMKLPVMVPPAMVPPVMMPPPLKGPVKPPIRSNLVSISTTNSPNIMTNPPEPMLSKIIKVPVEESKKVIPATSSPNWHEIILQHSGKASKPDLLRAIFRIIDDHQFFPTYYTGNGQTDTFLVRNCSEALTVLQRQCRDGLRINENTLIPMKIQLNFRHVNQNEPLFVNSVQNLLENRYNNELNTLDLSNFGSYPQIKSFSVSLAHSRTLDICLKFVKNFRDLTKLCLNHNNITSATSLDRLVCLTSLKVLDLSDNEIENFDEFLNRVPPNLTVTELILSPNPCCDKIPFSEYSRRLVEALPNLQKLDGRDVNITNTWHKNYLCDLQYYDFVNQFVQDYYRLYDSDNRQHLIEFYNPDSMFSMCLNYDFKKITITNSGRVNRHNSMSRNLLNTSSPALKLHIGSVNILNFLCEMPATIHDLTTFSIDVPMANANMIYITVSGLYKEMFHVREALDEFWLGFVRTFVIRPHIKDLGLYKRSVDYRICNEQLNLFNLSVEQVRQGFVRRQLPDVKSIVGGEIVPVQDRSYVIKLFQEITLMKAKWCEKCLLKVNWNFETALQTFIRLYEQNKIPDIAFVVEQNEKF